MQNATYFVRRRSTMNQLMDLLISYQKGVPFDVRLLCNSGGYAVTVYDLTEELDVFVLDILEE